MALEDLKAVIIFRQIGTWAEGMDDFDVTSFGNYFSLYRRPGPELALIKPSVPLINTLNRTQFFSVWLCPAWVPF